jgi:hypothetical protein
MVQIVPGYEESSGSAPHSNRSMTASNPEAVMPPVTRSKLTRLVTHVSCAESGNSIASFYIVMTQVERRLHYGSISASWVPLPLPLPYYAMH